MQPNQQYPQPGAGAGPPYHPYSSSSQQPPYNIAGAQQQRPPFNNIPPHSIAAGFAG